MIIMENYIQDLRCDIPLAIKEFYTLEALFALAKPEAFRHSHEKWAADFNEFRTKFNSQLANIIFDYTVMVVAGEMRHGYKESSQYIPDFFDDLNEREYVYENCEIYSPSSILSMGVKLFDESVKWSSGYGGPKWQQIANAGLYKGRLPDSLFIDHCVDLTHNGSIYFDKSTKIIRPLRSDALINYKCFLDFKRNCEPESLLQRVCSKRVQTLVSRAFILGIIKDCEPSKFEELSFDSNEDFILSYQPINWGCEMLASYLEDSNGDCEHGREYRNGDRYWRAA